MRLGKRRRRILKILIFFIAGILGIFVSLPVWFPWIFRPLARGQYLRYASYQRLGYNRFVLQGVTVTNEDIKISAERVESLLPPAWLWRCLVEKGKGADPFVTVDHWQVQTVPSTGPPGRRHLAQETVRDVFDVLETLRRWLPVAAVSNGQVRVEPILVTIPQAIWLRGNFSAKVGQASRLPPPAAAAPAGTNDTPTLGRTGGMLFLSESQVTAKLAQPRMGEVHLESDATHLHTTVLLDALALTLQSTTWWRSNRVDLAAEFASQGTLPVKATLQATNFQFPAALVQLPEFGQITGSLSAKWEHGRLSADVSADAQPRSVETNLPPIALQFHTRGNTNSAIIESAFVSAPWIRADLSRELEVFFNGPLLRQPARANISLDLGKQPWIGLQGILKGEAEFTPGPGKYPDATFHFAGSQVGQRMSPGSADVRGRGRPRPGPALPAARTLAVDGTLHWPSLELDQMSAKFDDGSSAEAGGKADLERKVLADGHLLFTGPLLRRFLPAGYSYESTSVAATVQGPFTNLAYSGHIAATNLVASEFKASRLALDCKGQGERVEEAHVSVVAGSSTLDIRGSVDIGDARTLPHPAQRDGSVRREIAVNLEGLSLLANGAPALELSRPCSISIVQSRPAERDTGAHVALSPLDWTGKAGDIHAQGCLDWPRQGTLILACSNLSSTLIADFLRSNLPPIEVRRLNGSGGWTNGPLVLGLDLALASEWRLPAPNRKDGSADKAVRAPAPALLSAALKLCADQNGLVLSNLTITSQTSSVASAQGFLPLSVYPGALTNVLRLDLEAPLHFAAATEPHAFFWNTLEAWTGLTLREPDLKLSVSGTWAAPEGEIDLRAQKIHLPKAMTNLPTVEQVVVVVRLDQQLARLSEGRMLVQGQPVQFDAEIPLGKSFWAGLREQKQPNWEKAKAHLALREAQIAAFQPLFPKVLAPEGSLALSMSLLPGGRLEGKLDIAHARTRPLGVAGPIRDIDVHMKFVERSLVLENASATMGGAPLNVSGKADLHGTEWMEGIVPPFQFTLHGTNVPLARQPGSIIRSDLNLTVAKTNDKPAVISGVAHLRDSFYLSDLSALVPGGVSAPSQRPPYFSIEDPPVSGWRLAVRVEGPHFLKVRSSLFNGQVSALLNLQGTLKDPIALGDAKIDSGVVRFPFASLEVQQGFVTLSSQDPYRPQLSVRASSKQYGYDIRMEVSGPADSPILQFSSTPPLASEQILLMVTAGELPKGEYTLSAQQKAQTVAMFVGRDLLAKLGYGDHAEQRLTIRSGEEISNQGKPTYHVEYKLSDHWYLEGEYDRFGDYNADLKWRVYSK